MRSVNQNHHLYVAKSVVQSGGTIDAGSKGQIQACVLDEGTDKDIYFKYAGYDGIVRSDLIPVSQITYMKHVPAATQVTKLKKVTVTLDSDIHSNGKPIAGQDYVLNIVFQQFYGLSPEDTYVKTVAVRATSSMSAGDFYDEMKNALNRGFSREVDATATTNPYLEFSSDANGIYITEKDQEQFWSLGKWESEKLVFDVFPSTVHVTADNDDLVWGTVDDKGFSNTVIPNNKRMADLEWFTFGERGDIYRGMGYPNNFDFVPMVTTDTSVVNGYDALEIHFAYQGSCEDIQKSEKDITIIGSADNIVTLKGILEGNGFIGKSFPVAKTDVDNAEDSGDDDGE